MGDVRYAVRQLAKAPGFTAAAAATLALGIGANTAMFSVVSGVLLTALPYEEPTRLVQVWEAPRHGQQNSVSAGVFSDWAAHHAAFEGLAALAGVELNLTGAAEPERISGLRMSPSGFQVLRARPLFGRTFAPDEDQAGKDKVVVLTYQLWRRRFGADPGIVGGAIRLNGESHTVVGVLPRAFLPWDKPEFVIPLVLTAQQTAHRSNHWLRVVGRLKPGISLAQAREDLLAVSGPFRPLYPAWKRDWGVTVVPMHEQLTGDIKPVLLVLLGAVGLVLLIACANVANLLLARASARRKEIAIRLALGATRGRVIRQLLAESVTLALLGAAIGLLLALAATTAIRRAAAANLPRVQEIGVDWRVLGFAMFVSVATGIVFGLVPALHASRSGPNESLKDGMRGSTGGRSRTRDALVVAEVALALVLLAGAGLLINSFVRLLHVSPGFDPRGALALHLSLPDQRYPPGEKQLAFTEGVLERIRALPGVEAAGAIMTLPLASWPTDTLITIPGRSGPADGAYPCDFDFTSTGTFRALGLRLTRGRAFDAHDTAASARVAIVNEAFVRAHCPTGEVLGQRIGERGEAWEIVGVVGDVRMRGLAVGVRPMLYRPLAFSPFSNRTLVLRTHAGISPRALIAPARQAILTADPEQPVQARTLEEVVAASLAQRRLILVILALFAGAAVLLAGVGLYGVIAYTVSQRTQEIGIRMAIGATRSDVVGLFVGEGLRLTGVGVALGVVGAVALVRLLASQLYGIEPTDPATLAAVTLLLLLVAFGASWLPARRAARVDPMQALR